MNPPMLANDDFKKTLRPISFLAISKDPQIYSMGLYDPTTFNEIIFPSFDKKMHFLLSTYHSYQENVLNHMESIITMPLTHLPHPYSEVNYKGIAVMTRHTKRVTILTKQKEECVVAQNRHR